MILKEMEPDKGVVKVGSNVKIGYLSQHVFTEIGDQQLIDVFRSEVVVNEGEARHILARFLFYGPAVFRKVSQLSGGERMRLRLAQLMYQAVNLLVLDEPTNHLDIDSCEVLEEALEQFNGTILAVSHDRYFLNKLFKKIYWLQDGTVRFFDGNYDWAKRKLEETITIKQPQEKPALSKTSLPKGSKVEKDEAGVLEEKIVEIEAEIQDLKQKLGVESELELLQKIYHELELRESSRDRLYQQLEEII
jgi:ATP-binding cassette, subfamily F, member 3